jgi:molybdopterin/thiamine biosynthesis adenylyltransferase
MDKRIIIVGLGAIGSHTAPLVARLPGVTAVVLIDADRYESGNLDTQQITVSDVGHSKVTAQARKLLAANPDLQVEAIPRLVEEVPLGRLRGNALVACVDNRLTRQSLNAIAWHLGMPLIDAAVDAGGSLVRVNCYLPHEGPCLECQWSGNDYRLLEQHYPCAGGTPQPSIATASPAELGALAAALQANALRKILHGDQPQSAGQQLMLDIANHKHYVDQLPSRAGKGCRFDHQYWEIHSIPQGPEISIDGLLEITGTSGPSANLSFPGHSFTHQLTCSNCGHRSQPLLRITGRLRPMELRCTACDGKQFAAGFDNSSSLHLGRLSQSVMQQSLSSIGFLTDDIIALTGTTGTTHIELGGHG